VTRRIVWTITFTGGLFFLLEFLLPQQAPEWLGGIKNPLTPYLGGVTNFLVVVATMAFLLGPFILLRSHVGNLVRRRQGWLEGLVFVVFLAASLLAAALREEQVRSVLSVLYDALFFGVLMAFFASSMALLAFYLVSAAHRAFRVSSLEAGLMMAAAAIVLLGQVPLGDWLTQGLPKSLQLASVTQWILGVPNTAVQRAVMIGACGGAFVAGFRQWLGLGKGAS
jgi:hypothetical protein